jgi:hypothetical protein
MADPVLVDHFRAQVVLQGKTALPEDRWVNNYCFRNDAVPGFTGDPIQVRIRKALSDFYSVAPTGQTAALRSFLTNLRLEAVTVNVYDLGIPPPRSPLVESMLVPLGASSTPVPEEAAVCCSYYAIQNRPRRRGRVYIGPLDVTALERTTTRVRTSDALRAVLSGCATRLMTGNGQSITWVILSGVDAAARVITGGWVDDAPDTQRRRGTAAAARTVWGAASTSAG